MFFITSHLLFKTPICHGLFQNEVNLSVLKFGWPIKVKTIHIPSLGQPKGGHGHFIELPVNMGFIYSILHFI